MRTKPATPDISLNKLELIFASLHTACMTYSERYFRQNIYLIFISEKLSGMNITNAAYMKLQPSPWYSDQSS
jgi:hypothetical protein